MTATDPVQAVEWTDAEREAAIKALAIEPVGDVVMVIHQDGTQAMGASLTIDAPAFADEVLAALAPFVADREREARVTALREAADAIWPIDGRTRDAKTMVIWLRAQADRIEADQ